jgi:hypothetical protein
MFTSLIASVLTPIFSDFFKTAAPAVSRKLFGESVDDTVKLAQVDITRVEALSKLDNPYGNPSLWVVNLRGSFRYIAAGILVISGVVVALLGLSENNPVAMAAGLEVATSPFGFIFGERMVLTFKGGGK